MPTITVRAQPEHHRLFRMIAARLKVNPGYAGTLLAVLDQAEDAPAAVVAGLHDIADRLAELERWIADHAAVHAAGAVMAAPVVTTATAPTPEEPPAAVASLAVPEPSGGNRQIDPPTDTTAALPTVADPFAAPAPADTTSLAEPATTGKRTYKKATPAERAEIVSLHRAGEKPADLAARFGVSISTVNRLVTKAGAAPE